MMRDEHTGLNILVRGERKRIAIVESTVDGGIAM